MATRKYETFSSHGWRGLICAQWASELGDRDPLSLTASSDAEVVRDRPAARTTHVRSEATPIYVKQIFRLKNTQSVPWSLTGMKWRFLPSRTLGQLQVSREMEAAGLRVPEILLAARRIAGLDAQELLVTRAIAGVPYVKLVRDCPDVDRVYRLAALAGRTLGKLHDAGLIHGDMAPGNLLVLPGDQEMALLDNDRTRHVSSLVELLEQRRNLVQLGFRLLVRRGYRGMRPMLDAYDQQRDRPTKLARRQRHLVVRATRRRLNDFIATADPEHLERLRQTPQVPSYRWPR